MKNIDFQKNEIQLMRYWHDETGRPYEDGESPFPPEVIREIAHKVVRGSVLEFPNSSVKERRNQKNPYLSGRRERKCLY